MSRALSDVERHRRERMRRLELENTALRAYRERLERILALAIPLDVLADLERAVDAGFRAEEVVARLPEILDSEVEP
jgi:hypothetical protein